MRCGRKKLWVIALCALLLRPPAVHAHGPVEASIARATAAIEKNPGNARLYLRRGELYRVHHEMALAEADYTRAAALEPTNPAVDLHLGRLFLDSDRIERAEETLSRFLARSPGHVTARMLRARALSRLGRRAEAVEDYAAAIALSENPSPELYLERARAQAAGGGGDNLQAALRGLDEGLARLGPVVTLELLAIELERKRGGFDAALGRLDRILARAPRKDAWLARRGEILEEAGRFAEARRAYAQALDAIEALPAARRLTRAAAAQKARLEEAHARLAPDEE